MNDFNIWFSTLKISYQSKLQLIKDFETPENIWNNFVDAQSTDKKYSNLFKESWNEKKIIEIKDKLIKYEIKMTMFYDKEYPEILRNYDDAPACIYYKGDISKVSENYNVAIVGSRKCTNYGINATKIISTELSKNKIGIISGMAKGIDYYAHTSSLDNGGFTCAVLGCGIDVVYPKENLKLYNSIARFGCLLSEFPPGTEPFAYNFPTRNRIISELSNLVIIVEADIKSGSLITANFALDKGIDVMAVPGSIFSDQSKGCNKLIKDGAYPITDLEDVFEHIGIENMEKEKPQKIIHCGIEKQIYGILNDNPIHIDDIIKLANIDIKHLYEVLFELQLKDEIMCLAGNYYVRVNKSI